MPQSTTSISINLDFSQEIIEREKLGALVNLMTKKKFILCKAPAGYGKSIGVQQAVDVLKSQQHQCIFVDYEANNGDQHFIARSLLSHLSGKATKNALGELSHTPAGASEQALPIPLEEALNGLTESLFIVVDNFHLSPSAADRQLIQILIHQQNPFIHVCLASRYEPGFNYRKLLLDGRASVVGEDRFAFSRAESTQMISRGLDDRPIKESFIDQLQAATQGWPVATRIGLHLLKTGEAIADIESALEKHHLIDSYFEEEVFGSITETLKKATAELALFEEFSADLITHGCEIPHAETTIDELRNNNLFIQTIEENQRVYRFHPLFRHFLLSCKWHPDQARRENLYAKAAAWCEHKGLNIQAIEYFLSAGSIKDAKRLLSLSAHTIVRDQGLPPKLIQWCEKIQPGNSPTAIYMNYWLAFSLTFSRLGSQAEAKIKELEQVIRFTKILGKKEKYLLKGQLWCLRIVLQVFKERADWCFKESESWLKQFENIADPYDVSVVYSARHDSARLLLNSQEARRSIVKAKESLAGLASPYAYMWLEMLDGLCEMEFGSFQVAHRVLEAAHKACLKTEGQTSPIASTISLLLARSLYESGDFHSAERYLAEGEQHIHDHGLTETAIVGVYLKHQLAARDNLDEALYQLKKFESMAGRHSERLSFMIRRYRISLLLRAGQIDAAEREASLAGVEISTGNNISVRESYSTIMEDEQIRLGIDLLYAHGRHRAALKHLKLLMAKPHTAQRPRFHVECLIILSALLASNQEKQVAGRQMSKALKIAHEHGLFQTFLDMRPYSELAIKELAKKRQSRGILPEDALLERICGQLGYLSESDDENSLDNINFSDRELELLGLLNSPLSIQGIADYVFLSKATVKWHLHNIYKKLGVKNRTGALSAAQQKGIV